MALYWRNPTPLPLDAEIGGHIGRDLFQQFEPIAGGDDYRPAPQPDAIWQGLKEADYVEGRNVAMEYRWAEGQPGQPPRRSSVVQCQAVAS